MREPSGEGGEAGRGAGEEGAASHLPGGESEEATSGASSLSAEGLRGDCEAIGAGLDCRSSTFPVVGGGSREPAT